MTNPIQRTFNLISHVLPGASTVSCKNCGGSFREVIEQHPYQRIPEIGTCSDCGAIFRVEADGWGVWLNQIKQR